MLESIFAQNIFLQDTQVVNLLSAVATFVIGCLSLAHDRKKPANQIAFLVALFVSFWAASSTMTDVMRSLQPALFWARISTVGPFFFAGFFVIFSYYFPDPRPLSTAKALLIMAPSIAILPFILTPLNVVSVRFAEWGTDFTPGVLYYLGLPYGIAYLVVGMRNFLRVRRSISDKLRRDQIMLVSAASALVIVSLIVTNVVLPLVFGYTQAGVWGAASTLVFVVMMSYAIFAKGALNAKTIATEFFCYLLIFLAAAQALVSDSLEVLVRNTVVLVCVSTVSVFLVRSVRHEVEQRKELELLSAELSLKNEKLKEMDTLKSDFISIASHQLRTPTSVIKGYLSLMLDGAYGKVDGPMRDKVVAMIDMAERLVVMINEMLNVSRIERNKISYACSKVDIAEIARIIVNELQFQASEKHIGLRLTTHDPVGTAMAYIDREKITEALCNIVENAVKYSTHGTVDVSVQARPTHKDVLIRVSDEGLGIAAADVPHLFEKFYRSGNPEVARITGTGLGLYVCRVFLRDMGGDVWVERSAPGQGTVFAVTLPTEPKNPNGLCTFPAS